MSVIPASGEINVEDAPKISSIEFVRQIIGNIQSQIHTVNDELSKASQGGDPKVKNLYELTDQLDRISCQAGTLIVDISADDRCTNLVNKSLDGSNKTLKKLEKLVESIKELEKELKEAQYDYYRNVAEMLSNVKQQMACFKAYGAIPHVILVQSKINAIESELQKHIQWCCREIGELTSSDPNADENGGQAESSIELQTLSQLYLVINVLGIPFRKDLLQRFSQLQLIPYEKIFGHLSKYSGLEHLDRRYAWFKRLLKAVEDRISSIFPSSYNLPYHLFVEFSRRTSTHMEDVLEHAANDHSDTTGHVASLLKALKSVLKFEAEMKASFDIQSQNIESESSADTKIAFIAPTSITEAFDNFLGPYVQLERQSLEELMSGLIREEDAIMKEESTNPNSTLIHSKEAYGSSHKMFEFIKSSLKRCTAFSTGSTYLSLSKEFRICLQHYAESLQFRCPSPASGKGGKAHYVVTPSGEQLMCRIVTTGEYCIDTVPQLEIMMKKHINPSLCDEIDFSVQIGAFMDMVSFTYSIMTAGVTERLDPAFKNFRKTNFCSIDSVGDDSKYVKEIATVLNETIPRVRPCMSAPYFQGFCMKLVTAVLTKLLENIWLLKRISQTGGGQLLLDLQGVKTYLLRMPNTRLPQGEEPLEISKAYSSVVNSNSILIERVLKLVCTDDSMMEDTFRMLWPDGKPSDLEAVVALKGSGNVALDTVGNVLNVVGVGAVGRGAKSAAGEISNGISNGAKAVGGGFKDLITGKLFEDISTHSKDDDNHTFTPTTPPVVVKTSGGALNATKGATQAASKTMGEVKSAFGNLNIFGPSSPPPHNNNQNNHSNSQNIGVNQSKNINQNGGSNQNRPQCVNITSASVNSNQNKNPNSSTSTQPNSNQYSNQNKGQTSTTAAIPTKKPSTAGASTGAGTGAGRA